MPDIQDRVVVSKVGTPLTHRRFLNRYKGSYGPAIRAGEVPFPFRQHLSTDCSCAGIGMPAVAGSGILAATQAPDGAAPKNEGVTVVPLLRSSQDSRKQHK